MDFIKSYIKHNKNKIKEVLVHSFVWMFVSLIAAYPDLCLKFDISIFKLTAVDEYNRLFVFPMLLFLFAFIFEFVFAIKDLNIGQKRGSLFKLLMFLICVVVLVFAVITVVPCVGMKIILFILLWMGISLIKGLTILIPGEVDVVMLKVPTTDINNKC